MAGAIPLYLIGIVRGEWRNISSSNALAVGGHAGTTEEAPREGGGLG